MDLYDKTRAVHQLVLEYKKSNRKVRKTVQEAKDEWIEEQGINIGKEIITSSNEKTFRIYKTLTNTCLS
ncbi:hypothetical protein DPMN_011934 [Dreissena polymorpha]|uniref:Uncharacterized protein n=1 Tax=Dreissena polymorpha TaxID=45954 RepID=A0A9D4S2X4_DREPO|nr:hypothetical protein DPMN_011934 [Dreissena polymorpha]